MDRSPPSERRLVLVRHGRSSHRHTGWIDADGFRTWRAAYESMGIRSDERVPPELEAWTHAADLTLSSDAERAIESARLLAPGRELVISPLLRELDLEAPALGGLRLPLAAWAVAVGARVLAMSLRGTHPSTAEAARLDEAAAWLGGLAERHALIVAVTHASFRRQLSRQLQQTGWRADPRSRSVKHWSAWVFRRPH